jgi:hypothetical protein
MPLRPWLLPFFRGGHVARITLSTRLVDQLFHPTNQPTPLTHDRPRYSSFPAQQGDFLAHFTHRFAASASQIVEIEGPHI